MNFNFWIEIFNRYHNCFLIIWVYFCNCINLEISCIAVQVAGFQISEELLDLNMNRTFSMFTRSPHLN